MIQPHDIISYIKTNRVESSEVSLQRAQNFFNKSKQLDTEIEEMETEEAEKITINILCPITYTPIKTPARGEVCTHI